MSMRRLMVRLTVPQLEVLEREAGRLGITVPDLLRRIVDAWREGRGGDGRGQA